MLAPWPSREALIDPTSTSDVSTPPTVTLSSGGSVPLRNKWGVDPSQREVLALCLTTWILFVSSVALLRNYFTAVDNFGDSSAYMTLAAAIRHWDFRGIVIKQFWGLPYAMAVLSRITGVSDRTALLLISLVSSFLGAALAYRLWGGWVAGFFAILSFDWMQRSYLGGSEPLFVALLFGSFLAVRNERWLLASVLASLATVVRPLGVFALVGIGITLLWKRDYRKFLLATAIGLVIGVLYTLPLASHFGNPMATVNSYHSQEWQGGWLFGFPFYAIIRGTLMEPPPLTNLILSFGWIFLVLLAIVAMVKTRRFREYSRAHPVEIMFIGPYIWCLYTYNYPHWARGNFARFAIPILPFVLIALYCQIPKDRRVLWATGLVTPLLAAASAIGVSNVLHLLRGALK
jgi:Gpi18-like mannosyltransferase